MKRLVLVIVASLALHACGLSEQNSLDEAIPRLQSPVDQIASLRTKWHGEEHIETVFYDRKGRVIEKFNFGRSSLKELHFYEGDLQKKSIYHQHGDSSEPGVVSIDTVMREFDANGRLVMETHLPAYLPDRKSAPERPTYSRHLTYTAKGDTIEKLTGKDLNDWQLVDIDRWERDGKGLLKHHYLLNVTGDPAYPDTVEHSSQKFSYDKKGRLKMVWFDSMYLGKLYSSPGPDTVLYHYNNQNQLSGEAHIYTSDMRNKREVDITKLSEEDKQMVAYSRQRFFTNAYGMSNARYVIAYKYEKFDPARNGKLIIPSN